MSARPATEAALRGRLTELARAGPPPGRAWCDAWTAAVDADLCSRLGTPRGRLAIVATGGYGRRELCPASDIDVLVLHDRLPEEALRATVREVVYPLWDAGLRVGHAVRDVREAATSAAGIETATALVDARTVCGDPSLLPEAHARLSRLLRRHRAEIVATLAAADEERRRRAGDAAEALEPDLRDGAGGMRDVQSLRWAAAALLGEPSLDALVASGYIGAGDRSRLAGAYERLLEVRVATHLAAAGLEGAGKDVLRLDVQADVARRLGLVPTDADDLPTVLLRDVFTAARTVDHVHRRATGLLAADASSRRRRRRGGGVVAGPLHVLVDGALHLSADPDGPLPWLLTTTLEALTATGAVLDRRAADVLRSRAEDLDAPDLWPAEDRDRLVAALMAGPTLVRAVAEVDDVGLLHAAIPEWEPVRARPQRHPIHRFSLDRHLVHAVAALADLLVSEPWAAEAAEGCGRRDALVLGLLLHDVGKPHGEPHSETGVPVADAITRRIGLDDEGRDLVRRIVRRHLLLPTVATTRDTADPGVVADVARTVGDPALLACLHLVAAADGLATGPGAWTPWKATLVADLVDRVDRHLRGVGDSRRPSGAQAPGPVARDAALTDLEVSVLLGDGALARHDTLRVAGPDRRRDLLVRVAGVLALHGGSVLEARAHADDDTLAAELVVVRPPDRGPPWWDEVRHDVARAASGRLAVRTHLADRVRHDRRSPVRRVPIPLTVTVTPAGDVSTIEVRAEDRPGLLYTIVATLAELDVAVRTVKATTLEHDAVDVLTVRGPDGALLEDHAAEVRLALTSVLA